MKRILFVVLAVLVAAPAAWAQAPFVPSFELGVGGGINVPMGDIGDGMNSGYNFNANVAYSVAPMFAVGAEVGVWGNGATDEVVAALGPNGDMSMLNWQFTAMGKYRVPMAMNNLYAKGLAGMYRTSSDVKSSLGDFSVADTNFGFGIGGGFEFGGMKNAAIYGEAVYHRISGEAADAEFTTFNVGVLFSL